MLSGKISPLSENEFPYYDALVFCLAIDRGSVAFCKQNLDKADWN
jgi:hypothetical protein